MHISDEREETTTRNTLPSKILIQIWRRNQKLSKQAKVKRIHHHQTSFTTNAKGTSLGREHKTRKRPTENKPKTIKKMVLGSYISIYTLNDKGLNAPTKRQAGWADESMCTQLLCLNAPLCWTPPRPFHIVRLTMFPLRLVIIIIFYFLPGYWSWKLINIFYYCDYVTVTH